MSGNRTKYFVSFLAFAFWIVASSSTALAVVKDTDTDGLTDTAETNTYLTDPNNYDTDGDTVSDGNEIINGTNPLDPESNPLALKENSSMNIWQILGIYSGATFIIFGIIAIYVFLFTKKPASEPVFPPEQTL